MTRLLLTAVFAVATAVIASPATHAQDASGAERSEVTTERFRDWALRCQSEGERRQCSIFQRLVVQETNQVALNLVIGFGQDVEGKQVPIAVFTFPLGIYLPAGAAFRVDEGEPQRMQIERCFNRGCQSAVALDPAQLETFKAGREAIVTIGQDREQAVDLRVSLSGFSAAYDALTATNARGN